MPIRKEHRDRYPENWRALAFEIKDANWWICQQCGRQCLRPSDSREGMSRAERARQTLTIAHYDSVYDAGPEGTPVLLLALCAGCHIRYDQRYHLSARRRNQRRRQREAGQLPLLNLARTT